MRGGVRVLGFHGTRVDKVDGILANGFTPNTKPWEWLGDGVYFFEESEARARDWAVMMHKENAAVLGAVIDLSGVMDLTEFGAIDSLRDTAKRVETVLTDAGLPVPENKSFGRREFDYAVIQMQCTLAADDGVVIRSVRGIFEEGETVHPRSSTMKLLTHVQLAIRDLSAILGVWKVKP